MRRIWDWMKICMANRLPDGRWLPEPRQYLVTPAYGSMPRKVKKVSVWRDEIELEGNIFVSLEWGDWEWEPYPLVLIRKINEKLQKFLDESKITISPDIRRAMEQMRLVRDQVQRLHYDPPAPLDLDPEGAKRIGTTEDEIPIWEKMEFDDDFRRMVRSEQERLTGKSILR